ncbi:hypothetical protein CAPTEDRAFT_205445 [Capitella teleta]|uniref:Uncharacterized protein n=1 Tax=Capitella teleta TaxID=283909 RepID=R7U2L2_CAPTE|nr:hypothetical protein CAPTEDRAFT_205445 [Capitella teleta]|eukprot:ELT97405.1 hypothetical protein CAPTEDRAFT_205445 [Capitella teleta]
MTTLGDDDVIVRHRKKVPASNERTFPKSRSESISMEFYEGSIFYACLDLLFSAVAFLFVLLLMPFLVVLSFAIRVYREKKDKLLTQEANVMLMKSSDAIWMQESNENKSVINSVMVFQGKPDLAVFRKLIKQRLVDAKDKTGDRLFNKITMYTNRLLRNYVWVEDPDFDIEQHVYMYPEKVSSKQECLEQVVSEISSVSLPSKKSPWQFIILEPLETNATHYHVVFRVHHSVGDGVSLVRALIFRIVDSIPEEVTKKRFGTTNKLWKIIHSIFYGPSLLIKRLGWPADSNTILHGQELSGEKVVSWSENIDLEFIKELKDRTDTTVNDVLMSCLAGALRDFLRKHDAQLPTDISAYVPVDIRPPKSKLVLDNQFALVFLHLPVDCENSLDALKKTRHRMNQIKGSPEALVNAMVINYSMSRLPDWFSTRVFNWFSQKCSMVLSNVPGPTQQISLGGQPITEIIFWPPQRSNVALGVGIFSYTGTVKVGVISDKAVLTNPRPLVSEFVKRLYQLADEIGEAQHQQQQKQRQP